MKQTLTLLLTILMLTVTGCGYAPDPQDDIALFQPFIDANINKKSDDPYISSTVKPGDKLYEILVNIQHGRHDLAIEKLKPLVEQGDAEAQFWYAKMIYRSSIKNIAPALELYKQSMKQNNPFAYMMLSPGLISSGCVAYFGLYNCTMNNFNKAVEIFKQRAKNGDLRAQYFLLSVIKPNGDYVKDGTYANKFHLTDSAQTREHYLKEVIRFAENHYYQPLMDYVDTILFWTGEYPNNHLIAKTPEQYQLAIDLLTIMANHNYIPALNRLVTINQEHLEKGAPIYQQLYQLGGGYYFLYQAYYYSEQYTQEELYIFAHAYEVMNGSSELFMKVDGYPRAFQRQEELEKQAELLLQKMTPMVYIDEFTSRDDWIDD